MILFPLRKPGEIIFITTGKVIRCLDFLIPSAKADHTHKWHNRLVHIGIKVLNSYERGAFGNDFVPDFSFCDNCVLGKHHRSSFSTNIYKTKDMLKYVHSNLWDLASNPTSGGNWYFMSIIDNYTRKVWVYLLKDKSDAFHSFNNWKRQVENYIGKMTKFLRIDNVLEFCDIEFDNMYKENGITRYNQQNEVVERMNITIFDKVRCLMLSSGIPKSFCRESIMIAYYLN